LHGGRPGADRGGHRGAEFGYALLSCLILNDPVKVALIRWQIPNAAARQPATASAAPKGGI